MQTIHSRRRNRVGQCGFTLPELMVATALGLPIAGAIVLLLLMSGVEQRLGLAETTVETQANSLQAQIMTCLRTMSANQGLSPDYTSRFEDESGHLLGYQRVFVFYANPNGTYTRGQIWLESASGRVIYTPDVSVPASKVVWMAKNPTVALRQLCFSTSFNPDGSLNSSLVNVQFLLDDNGASQQPATNNLTSIYRSFSIRMRGDS